MFSIQPETMRECYVQQICIGYSVLEVGEPWSLRECEILNSRVLKSSK